MNTQAFIRSMYGAGRALSQTEKHLMGIVQELTNQIERLEQNVQKISERTDALDRRSSNKGTGSTVSTDGVQQPDDKGGVGVSRGTTGRNKQTKVHKKTTSKREVK